MLNWLNKKMKKRKGFTLVELVVVIAILGILAAVAVPRFSNQTKTAKENADKATARTIASAVTMAIAEKEDGDPSKDEINKYLSGIQIESLGAAGTTNDNKWYVILPTDTQDIQIFKGTKEIKINEIQE